MVGNWRFSLRDLFSTLAVVAVALALLDTDDLRELLHIMLEQRGYNVIEAADGSQAVQEATEKRPDLILMDLNLPVLSGLDAVRQRYAPDADAEIVEGSCLGRCDSAPACTVTVVLTRVMMTGPNRALTRGFWRTDESGTRADRAAVRACCS